MKIPVDELKVRLAEARKLASPCRICFRECGVFRFRGERGYCGIERGGNIFLHEILVGEEAILNPTYALFLAGCNLRCAFCYEAEVNRKALDVPEVSPETAANWIVQRVPERAKNVHWVGGEPIVHLPWILDVLSRLPASIQVVWNSNMAMSSAARDILLGVPDIVVADLHFGNAHCAEKMGASPAHLHAAREAISRFAGRSLMIFRYLYLPGHETCCLVPLLQWIKDTIPHVPVNIMGQYLPPVNPGAAPEAPLPPDALKSARDLARKMGLHIITSVEEPVPERPVEPGFETEIEIFPNGSISFQQLPADFIPLIRKLASRKEPVS